MSHRAAPGMKTRRHIAIYGAFPAELWRDPPAREPAWASLRDKAAEIAAADGRILVSRPPDEVRSLLYLRVADTADGAPKEVECTAEEAEIVRLRLACWAAGG